MVRWSAFSSKLQLKAKREIYAINKQINDAHLVISINNFIKTPGKQDSLCAVCASNVLHV